MPSLRLVPVGTRAYVPVLPFLCVRIPRLGHVVHDNVPIVASRNEVVRGRGNCSDCRLIRAQSVQQVARLPIVDMEHAVSSATQTQWTTEMERIDEVRVLGEAIQDAKRLALVYDVNEAIGPRCEKLGGVLDWCTDETHGPFCVLTRVKMKR